MVQEEHEAPARLEHACDLGDRRPVVGKVLEHEAHDAASKRASANGRCSALPADVARPAAALGARP